MAALRRNLAKKLVDLALKSKGLVLALRGQFIMVQCNDEKRT
jgi:hypothetical protein